MANEEQYYNPIIQALVASAQNQQAKEKLKADIENQKMVQKAREHQLQIEETRAEHQHEHETGMLGVAQKHLEALLEANKLERIKQARDLSLSGIDVGAALKSVGGQDIGGIPTTEDLMKLESKRLQSSAQATSTGTHAGAAPFLAAQAEQKHQNDIDLALTNHAQRALEIEQQGGNAERLARVHGGFQQSVANINGANHLRGIALMHQLGMDSGNGEGANQARDLVDGIYNGTTDYKGLTQDQKRAVNSYATANGEEKGLPTDTKSYAKKLDSLSSLQGIMDQYRDLANNYSRDSPGAYAKGSQNLTLPIVGTLHRTQPGSDLESKLNSMKSSGGQLATYFDQQNRKSDAEILRQVTGSFDPKATKQQNLDKLENHITQLQQAVRNSFSGMTTDRINKILGDRNITDFGAFKPLTAINRANGHRIESHDNGKTWIDSVSHQPFTPPTQ